MTRPWPILALLALAAALLLALLPPAAHAQDRPPPWWLRPSRTPTLTRTPTPTRTPTLTRTPVPTRTPGPTRAATRTPWWWLSSKTPTPSVTPSPTPTPEPWWWRTPTPPPTATRTPTATPTETVTPSPTATDTGTPTAGPSRTPTPPGTDGYALLAEALIAQVRSERGLPPVAHHDALARSAQAYVLNQAAQGCYGHSCPPVTNFVDRNIQAGYMPWARMAEIAGGGHETPTDIVLGGWMNSPPHRDVIVDPVYREVGCGFTYGPSPGGYPGTYWVCEFGLR